MSRKPHYGLTKKFAVLERLERGESYAAIAKAEQVSKSTITGWKNDPDLQRAFIVHKAQKEERARLGVAASDASDPDGNGEPDDVVFVDFATSGWSARVVKEMTAAISRGAFVKRGETFDFGRAASLVGVTKAELAAAASAAGRDDERFVGIWRRFTRTAQEHELSIFDRWNKDGSREALRLLYNATHESGGADEGLTAAGANLTDKELEAFDVAEEADRQWRAEEDD